MARGRCSHTARAQHRRARQRQRHPSPRSTTVNAYVNYLTTIIDTYR